MKQNKTKQEGGADKKVSPFFDYLSESTARKRRSNQMNRLSESYFLSSDGKTKIHVNKWTPENTYVRGVIQIAHGVAEYGYRYHHFAEFLCDQGFVVVANDHLGHGNSIIPDKPRLYFGENEGWWYVVDDMEKLRCKTAQEYPGRPYFLFGHSMGSFLSRSYLIRYPGQMDGCILCGTGHPSKVTILGGKVVSGVERKRLGAEKFSALTDQLAFGSYNKKFAPSRTQVDWVSANEENVDAYVKDPLCGGETTVGLFQELLFGLRFITKQTNINKMNKNQPILFIAGKNDPVGNMGKGVQKAYRCFQKAGIKDVELKLYEEMRHEILNEKRREEVYKDIMEWLNKKQ